MRLYTGGSWQRDPRLLLAPRAPVAQPPTHVHRIGRFLGYCPIRPAGTPHDGSPSDKPSAAHPLQESPHQMGLVLV